MNNPLLSFDDLPRFDQIAPSHVAPAIDALLADANAALETVTAYLEPGLAQAAPDERFQFERHGYFVADRVDSVPGKPVFNRVTTLKDSWGK